VKYREVIRRLRKLGVTEYPSRGKGSERILVRETFPGSRKGPMATITCHGEGKDVPEGTLRACLRRLGINKEEFEKADQSIPVCSKEHETHPTTIRQLCLLADIIAAIYCCHLPPNTGSISD